MKITSIQKPIKIFNVIKSSSSCIVEFYDNVNSITETDGMTGQEITVWEYEKYVIAEPYRVNLFADIESNFSTWLQKAKDYEISVEETKVRVYRDKLLNDCDLRHCNAEKWMNMVDDKKLVWSAYKQTLRDIPEQVGFPYMINWPIIPE